MDCRGLGDDMVKMGFMMGVLTAMILTATALGGVAGASGAGGDVGTIGGFHLGDTHVCVGPSGVSFDLRNPGESPPCEYLLSPFYLESEIRDVYGTHVHLWV